MTNILTGQKPGQFAAIIGPNGAGKTTLLNLLVGDTQPSQGTVTIAGKNIEGISRLQLAQQRAVLPQIGHVPFAIKVRDIVALGREPYRYDTCQQHNQAVIVDCLRTLDIVHLADNNYTTLSGGEQHRVQIARTLAQIFHQPDCDLSGKILFLDEPTNHLDIHHQYALMKTLKSLQEKGLTVVAIMHDLSLTLQFADNIILLNKGTSVGCYAPSELIDSGQLSTVYQMQMNAHWDDKANRYLIYPSL